MANQVLTKNLKPTLDFADVSGALEYWVQIAANPRFVTLTEQQAGLATSQMTPAANLTNAQKYFWRFRTRTSADFTSDQANATASAAGSALLDAVARTGLAQGFKAAYSLPLKKVTVSLKRTGSPGGNVWAEIWSSGSGLPSAQLGADSAVIATATIGTAAFETVTFTFATPIPLVAGTVYHVVLQGSYAITGAAYVTWEDSGSATYADGTPSKENAGGGWSTNGTSSMVFAEYVHSWSAWSDVWSFWVDTTFGVAVTPSKCMLVDPAATSDQYAFAVAPIVYAYPEHIQRDLARNLSGNLLSEYTKTMMNLQLDFGDAYVQAVQAAEMIRFYQMEKAVFLITMVYNGQDTVENIYKAEFAEDVDLQAIAAGRYDLKTGTLNFAEAAWS